MDGLLFHRKKISRVHSSTTSARMIVSSLRKPWPAVKACHAEAGGSMKQLGIGRIPTDAVRRGFFASASARSCVASVEIMLKNNVPRFVS